MAEARAKGVLFTHLREYTKKEHGEDGWNRVLENLPPADVELLRGILLAGSWYPVGAWNRALASYLTTLHGANPGKAMAVFADYVADKDLNSFVKVVLKLGSPEFILKRTTWLWERYFDVGSYAAEELEPRHWRMWLSAPLGEDEAAGRFTCGDGVAPWLERGLKLSGASNGKVRHVKCRFDTKGKCEYEATW